MITINLTATVDRLMSRVEDIQRRQLPFAISRALTDTAFAVRSHIVETTGPRDFTLRNKRFLGVALRVQAARKDNLQAIVYDRLGREYLTTQAIGGQKIPRRGRIAVPQGQARAKRGTGGVPKRLRPGAPGVFKLKAKDGTEILAKRTGRRGRQIETLFTLARQARIPKRFRVVEDASVVAQKVFGEALDRRFTAAIASAR